MSVGNTQRRVETYASLTMLTGTMRERTPFPADLVERLPNLKLLLTTGPRNASIDLGACKARRIPVAGTVDPKRGSPIAPDTTTQHCVALILAAARNLAADDASVKSGGWQTSYALTLAGKTLGVVGLGKLGMKVARIMSLVFDMRVVAWSTNLTQEKADEQAKAAGLPVEREEDGEKTFKVVSREELFKTADVVSLHLVLSDRSRGLVTGKDLEMMKQSSIFVNTARGPLVEENDLLDVLKKGKIRTAALDVYDLEPLPLDSPWRTTNWGEDGRSLVLLSPHMGYVEKASLEEWYEQQVSNILAWKDGKALMHSLTG